MNADERQLNEAAYRRLKESIGQNYPAGHFVAISGGQIIADAGRLEDLIASVARLGKKPGDVLAVEAGVDYPETAVILAAGLRQ